VPDCALCQRLSRVQTDAALLHEWADCCVILGDNGGSRGWCTLITTEHIEHLDALEPAKQMELFGKVALVARAIRSVFAHSGAGGGPPRINYECLGNVCPHVHWHIIPRHANDPTPNATVWGWPPEVLAGNPAFRAEDAARLRAAIANPEACRGMIERK
jgi:diadenosine tetraphosphate (Ap4A) HIT family hydrolase